MQSRNNICPHHPPTTRDFGCGGGVRALAHENPDNLTKKFSPNQGLTLQLKYVTTDIHIFSQYGDALDPTRLLPAHKLQDAKMDSSKTPVKLVKVTRVLGRTGASPR